MSDPVIPENPEIPEIPEIEVRISGPKDVTLAKVAQRLIDLVVEQADIARRSTKMLRAKIVAGQAAVAFCGDELIGFGYFSAWQQGQFVSHSGLVVRSDFQGHGLGRRLKQCLFGASRALYPEACIISLTTSPAVEAMNLSLGFQRVPLDQLTSDPEFWKGCETCRNYAAVQRQGKRCCCFGMLLRP